MELCRPLHLEVKLLKREPSSHPRQRSPILLTTKEKCPQDVCKGKGEYITYHTCSNKNDLDIYPATTCDCGREFNSLRGLRIHKARWCKRRNSPIGKCKSNDWLMNQEHPHSVQKPIAKRQRHGDIPSEPKIQWPKSNQIATWTNLD